MNGCGTKIATCGQLAFRNSKSGNRNGVLSDHSLLPWSCLLRRQLISQVLLPDVNQYRITNDITQIQILMRSINAPKND